MTNQAVLQFLGLAARARKIISGEELVVKEIRHGNAKLVLLASDASANTSKKLKINVRITTLSYMFLEIAMI